MSSKFNDFLTKSLQTLNTTSSAHLGDRSQYVGGSDVSQCLRKVVDAKMNDVTHDNKSLLRFLRGHAVQNMFSEIFTAGNATFKEEVEVTHPTKPYIKAHIDFVFYSAKRIYVVEMKSVNGIPEETRSSHLDQLGLQMGLLRQVTPAEIAIEGCVLYVDINAAEWDVRNGHNADSLEMKAIYTESERRADKIWQSVQNNELPDPESSFLCPWCHCYDACPAHQLPEVIIPPDVLDTAKKYLALVAQSKRIKGKTDALKLEILGYTGKRFKGMSDGIGITVTTSNDSEMIDTEKLQSLYPDVYLACLKPRAGSTKLQVRTITKKPAKVTKQDS
jgi:CRISPR-associated exonuclease Cas4